MFPSHENIRQVIHDVSSHSNVNVPECWALLHPHRLCNVTDCKTAQLSVRHCTLAMPLPHDIKASYTGTKSISPSLVGKKSEDVCVSLQ